MRKRTTGRTRARACRASLSTPPSPSPPLTYPSLLGHRHHSFSSSRAVKRTLRSERDRFLPLTSRPWDLGKKIFEKNSLAYVYDVYVVQVVFLICSIGILRKINLINFYPRWFFFFFAEKVSREFWNVKFIKL